MPQTPTASDLAELFTQSGPDLARYFQRRHQAAEMVADLVQETFLHMAESLQAGRAVANLRGYLFGIARHLSHRAWATHQHEPLDLEAPAPQPDERIRATREIIAAMPALQAEILDLRFTQNLTYAEIAEALRIPIGTVRSRLHHAVTELRELLHTELNL